MKIEADSEVRGGSNNYYEKERVNMDYESALEYIHHCIDVGNIIFEIPKDEEIINVIKVALEKQIAKAPMQNYYNEGDYAWECVSCEEVVTEGQNYCHNCGQKLLELD